tara:strand:- start:1366 stop:1707 length:342 start_codon:yes stop_codon:yes gene_type:complete
MASVEDKQQVCPVCHAKELQKVRNDLSECKKKNQANVRKIRVMEKKVFILTITTVAIGAIFGKEALDSVMSWIESYGNVKTAVDGIGLRHPSPGALPLLATAFLFGSSRKRKH